MVAAIRGQNHGGVSRPKCRRRFAAKMTVVIRGQNVGGVLRQNMEGTATGVMITADLRRSGQGRPWGPYSCADFAPF